MLTTLSNFVNRGLPRSPRARELCAELDGRSVAVVVSGVAHLILTARGGMLSVTRHAAPGADAGASASASTDATLSGGPFSLLALAQSDATAALPAGVTLAGDTDVAQRFRELLRLLRPDLEEELSLLLGDVPAHQLGRLARGGMRWARRAAGTSLENLAEYLGHERRDLVPRQEGEPFLRGVDQLRESVDRVEARLDLLARQRGTS